MALSPDESRRALILVAAAGLTQFEQLFGQLGTEADEIRDGLLVAVPEIVTTYGTATAALAADWYDDVRDEAGAAKRFTAAPEVPDRSARVEAMIRWGVDPLYSATPDYEEAASRIYQNVQREIALPHRATITANTRRDPASVGWRRIAAGGCSFCRMLAGRGEVYRQDTARFASHKNCNCTAAPVFDGEDGEEASVLQYEASQRRQTEASRKRVRDYLAKMDEREGVRAHGVRKPEPAKPTGFNAMSKAQIQKQLDILGPLKDTPYRATQMARLQKRLAELS